MVDASPVVSTDAGDVRGELVYDVAYFFGVPFAAPPVGPLRWRKPQPAERWSGTLDCTAGRPADQRSSRPPQTGQNASCACEDCLYLHVNAPAAFFSSAGSVDKQANAATGAPVLLHFYGGAFLMGGSKPTGGQPYADRGIVAVSCNYRIGALGFLCPEGGDANCGLWDQVAALRWIQRNIAAFGGDPMNVTIMGNSAGADSCYYLACAKPARGLFHRAIMQSCSQFALSMQQAREMAEEFAEVAGAKSASLADMQALSVDQVIAAQSRGMFRLTHCCGPGWRLRHQAGGKLPSAVPPTAASDAGLLRLPEPGMGWVIPTVVVDGEFLTEQPLEALAAGAAKDLEIIIGCTRDEDAGAARVEGNGEDLLPRLAWELAGMPGLLGEPAERISELCSALIAEYKKEVAADVWSLGECGNSGTAVQYLQDIIMSDVSFITATELMAERLRQPGCTKKLFRYQFQGFGSRSIAKREATARHSSEMCMCYGDDRQQLRKGRWEVRTQWLDSWSAFMRRGDPNTEEIAGAWKPFDGSGSSIFSWDGVDGWLAATPELDKRCGLRATCRLYERLWNLTPAVAAAMAVDSPRPH
eukprot:TRINITY_DN35450_c0_g1_i1.p1 TRINITY_DN35450_c0_g1~~TRINITY_DN35450_c0_g1_i1.p1  ORF type:complete len:586 (-),score=124.06 TRINITY_DN35450_c0_g1_i1:338-2095(-)